MYTSTCGGYGMNKHLTKIKFQIFLNARMTYRISISSCITLPLLKSTVIHPVMEHKMVFTISLMYPPDFRHLPLSSTISSHLHHSACELFNRQTLCAGTSRWKIEKFHGAYIYYLSIYRSIDRSIYLSIICI